MATEGAVAQKDFSPAPLGSLFGDKGESTLDQSEPDETSSEGAKGAEGEAEAGKGTGKTKTTEETETVETDASTASDDPDNEVAGLRSALQAERAKRKAAEAQLEAGPTETSSNETETASIAKPQDVQIDLPSIYDGESGFQQGLGTAVKQIVRQEQFNDRLEVSQIKVVEEHGEQVVQQAVDRMALIMKDNPAMLQRFRSSPEPLVTLMQMDADAQKAAKLADPDYVKQWEKEAEERITAKVRAELEGRNAEEQALDGTIPDSLSGSGSKGDLKSGAAYRGPKSLGDLLPG